MSTRIAVLFWVSIEDIKAVLNGQDKNVTGYCGLAEMKLRNFRDGKFVFFKFWMLDEDYTGNVSGYTEEVRISDEVMTRFVSSLTKDGEELALLSHDDKTPLRVTFNAAHTLETVSNNPVVRRKFSHYMGKVFNARNMGVTEVRVYDDFAPYSFGFKKLGLDGKPVLSGGLIFTQGLNKKTGVWSDELRYGRYSMHT